MAKTLNFIQGGIDYMLGQPGPYGFGSGELVASQDTHPSKIQLRM